jgi:hypothetical protein
MPRNKEWRRKLSLAIKARWDAGKGTGFQKVQPYLQ